MHVSIWQLHNTPRVTVRRTLQFGQTVDMDETSSTNASTSASVSPPSVKSDVWKYFQKSTELIKVKCSLCSNILSYGGGTRSKKQATLCTVHI